MIWEMFVQISMTDVGFGNNRGFVQISMTDVGFGNNRGRRLRLLQNPNEVFDICTNTSNKFFISILLLLKHVRMF